MPLFPRPLHLTRTVEDGISGQRTTVDEYCYGDRIVSISGQRTVINDYAAQETTEIDRAAGTWSVARFDELARANAAVAHARRIAGDSVKQAASQWKTVAPNASSRAESYAYEESTAEGTKRIEISLDRGVALSREAAEVLIGSAYPNDPSDEQEPLLRAMSGGKLRGASDSLDSSVSYALPSEQTFTYDFGGSRVIVRNAVTRVGSETVPPDRLLIPPGARKVEPRAVETARELRDLDLTTVSRSQ